MKAFSVFTLLCALGSLASHAAIVGEWDADDFTGGATWPGTADATVREGTPTAGSDNTSFPGFDLDFVSFGPPDAAFEVAAAGNGVAGLAEFSASVVFRTTSTGSSGEDDFWRNEGLVGIELGGGGVGDWGVGIAAGGLINGGSALHAGDSGSLGPVVNDNTWHVATMVIDDLDNSTHDRRLYLDGVEVASDLALVNGGGSSVAANSALFFGDNQPGDGNATKENYEGDIAHIRLDDVALSPAEISTLHGDYLGTRVSTSDTDNDTLPDNWETSWPAITLLTELDGNAAGPGPGAGTGDFDGDGLSDAGELAADTDPTDPDSDNDNVSDGDEIANGTDPTKGDTDGDGLTDDVETNTGNFNGPTDTGTDPLNPDTDGDGFFNDGQEVANNTDPNNANDPLIPTDGGALFLDGTDDFVSFENLDGTIPSGAEPFTLEAWINPTTIPAGGGNGGQILFWGNQSSNQSNGFRLRGTNAVRHYFWGNDHDEDFTEDITPDTTGPNGDGWHHLALTYDGTQTIWYWNGAPLGNPRAVSGVNVADLNHRIGARLGPDEDYHGFIDEIRIWNVARTETEIAENFGFALPPDEAGLVTYFDFGSGLTDITGNGHDGTPQGDSAVDPFQNAPIVSLNVPKVDLRVDRNGNDIVLTWSSKAGKLYTVRSAVDPSVAEPVAWSIFAGNENIAATPTENTLSFALPADEVRFFVVEEFDAPPVAILDSDFEGGQGSWTTGADAGAAGTAWALGSPSNVGPPAANSGSFCFGTNIGANYTDLNDLTIWLRSPAIDLSAAGGATLSFFQFVDIEGMFDEGIVNVLDASDDSLIVNLQPRIDGVSVGWEQFTRKLPNEALGKMIKIEFVFSSDDFNGVEQAGWYIDDIVVTVP